MMNQKEQDTLNQLLSHVGKQQVGISKPEATEDQKLLEGFLSCKEETLNTLKGDKQDKLTITKGDLQRIATAQREIKLLLADMKNEPMQTLKGFYLKHLAHYAATIDGVLAKYHV